MLQLKNVSKFYYSKGVVTSGFSKVNLKLEQGEFVAITGESGSGKSTLLNVLSGLDSYEEGEMLVEGEDTSAYSETEWEKYRRKYISNIFQNFNLVSSYTVYQNVELALLLSGYRGKDRRERVLEVLRKVELYDHRNQRASRLSGGQKQRVAIARALVRNTPIIVADEPTGNLDSKAAANVIELLSRVAADKLVLVVTHNYDQVESYVTRRITMHDGRIVEDVHLRSTVPVEQAPAEEAGVYEATVRRVSFWQRLRLGIRNAFNIVPKFLLLLLVFLFASAAVGGYYVSDLAAKDNSLDMGYNYYFNNTSRERIILKKADATAFTQEDFQQLAALPNVATVHHDDLLLDNSVNLSGDFDLSGTAYDLDTFTGTPDYGTLPSGKKEVLLCLHSSDYLCDEETIAQLMQSKLTLYDWISDSSLMSGITISGVVVDKELGYDQSFYCPESVLSVIRSQTNLNYSTIQVTINEKTMTADPGSYQYRLAGSDQVESGEAMVSEDTHFLFDSMWCIDKPLDVHISNLYYETDASYTIAKTYNRDNWTERTGRSEDSYDWQNGVIFINQKDYAKLFRSGSYQSSVFVEDTDRLHQTADALRELGYIPLCMSDTLVDDTSGFQDMMGVLDTARAVILFAATFFVAYFVIRLIMKSRNSYFTTVRILGATRSDCGHLLFIDLTTVLCVAYAVLSAFVVAVQRDWLHIAELREYVAYLTPIHFLILLGVLVVMCVLIALRYSRKLFKASAMKTYKEVG